MWTTARGTRHPIWGCLMVLIVVLQSSCSSYGQGTYLYGGATRAARKLPEFPSPPPAYTAQYTLPQKLFSQLPDRLGAIHQEIGRRLAEAGMEGSTFAFGRDGFAVATTTRCIEDDGTVRRIQGRACKEPNRGLDWSSSFSEYLQALFGTEPGHYRMFVFVVAPPFVPGKANATFEQADVVWSRGATHLPGELAGRRLPADSRVTALVYEFERESLSEPSAELVPLGGSVVSGRTHLILSGWAAQGEL